MDVVAKILGKRKKDVWSKNNTVTESLQRMRRGQERYENLERSGMTGHYCDNCGYNLENKDYTSYGSWSYTCPKCKHKYKHGA